MEYLLGFLTVFFLFWVMSSIMLKDVSDIKKNKIINSQSHTYVLMKPFLIKPTTRKIEKKSQSLNHHNNHNIKAIVIDENAYWIKNNSVYVADMINEEIDPNTKKVVDIMGMDSVELDKMLFIVDKLTDRSKNDNRGSGN